MVQRPFDSWESRFVKIWTVCNLQDEHDMTVTGRDRHDPRKAILSSVFFTKTKLSIAFGRLGYIYIYPLLHKPLDFHIYANAYPRVTMEKLGFDMI